jgi:hypothetical protein
MISAGRHLDDIDMCDLVKDNVLPLHMSWTSLIEPLVTTRVKLEALIFSRGVHLEAKELALQSDRKTELTAFPAYESDDDNMQGMREQLASLTTRFNGKGGSRGGSRFGRGGGRCLDPSIDTMSCYKCGKHGNLRPNCPDLPKNKKKLDKAEGSNDHAWSTVAFVASTSALMSAASSSESPSAKVTWVIDTGATRHCSAALSDFAELKTSVMGSVSGIVCEVKGVGDVEVTVNNKIGLPITLTLKEVLYVPGLRERSKGLYLRLLSVRRATQVGYHCTFSKSEDVLNLLTGPPVILVRRCGLI